MGPYLDIIVRVYILRRVIHNSYCHSFLTYEDKRKSFLIRWRRWTGRYKSNFRNPLAFLSALMILKLLLMGSSPANTLQHDRISANQHPVWMEIYLVEIEHVEFAGRRVKPSPSSSSALTRIRNGIQIRSNLSAIINYKSVIILSIIRSKRNQCNCSHLQNWREWKSLLLHLDRQSRRKNGLLLCCISDVSPTYWF